MSKIRKFLGTAFIALSMSGAPAPAIIAVTTIAVIVPVSAQATPVITLELRGDAGEIEATRPIWADNLNELVLSMMATDVGGGNTLFEWTFFVPSAPIIVGRSSSGTLSTGPYAVVDLLAFQVGPGFTGANILDITAGWYLDTFNFGFDSITGIGATGLNCSVCPGFLLTDYGPGGGSFAAEGVDANGNKVGAYNSSLNGTYVGNLDQLAVNGYTVAPMFAPSDTGGPGNNVPEPGTLVLALFGVAGIKFFRRKGRA